MGFEEDLRVERGFCRMETEKLRRCGDSQFLYGELLWAKEWMQAQRDDRGDIAVIGAGLLSRKKRSLKQLLPSSQAVLTS